MDLWFVVLAYPDRTFKVFMCKGVDEAETLIKKHRTRQSRQVISWTAGRVVNIYIALRKLKLMLARDIEDDLAAGVI